MDALMGADSPPPGPWGVPATPPALFDGAGKPSADVEGPRPVGVGGGLDLPYSVCETAVSHQLFSWR